MPSIVRSRKYGNGKLLDAIKARLVDAEEPGKG
jgi:hypothetical protein